jgi:hypothetical protein
LHAGGATTTAAGIYGRGFVAVNAQYGLEAAFPRGHTLAADLAAFVVNPGRDDGVKGTHNSHRIDYSVFHETLGARSTTAPCRQIMVHIPQP